MQFTNPITFKTKTPEDQNIKIWRYMDFTKFAFMLEEQSLFFSRADCFDDPFEGSFPKANEQLRNIIFSDPDIHSEATATILKQWSDFHRWHRQWAMINCWHMNEYESAAMWKLYARTNEAICVQSTYERLRKTLDDDINIGEVQYIDYRSQVLAEGNPEFTFLFKRKSFEHEHELRAIYYRLPVSDSSIDYAAAPPVGGILKKVDLDILVENIYVAPSSPRWFHELIEKVVIRYGLRKAVIQSSLDDKPFF